jgi:hypothetical protein
MASSLPHPVPSRTAHAIAALYGHEDDTLIAWQRFCAQAAEALRPQPDPERLSKALALAQGGHVALEDDGYALVTSGTKRYQVQADGVCDCPDYQHRGTPCKHVLAVLIHARAQELVAPSPSPAPTAAAASAPAASAPAKAPRPSKPRSSAAWDVHEAPVSSCFKIRVGAFEWTHTMRASDDAELHTRVQAFVPTFREVVAALDALQAEREAAKAAPAVLPPPPAAPAVFPQPDLQALLQQAVQQALAAQANGQAPSTPPPTPSSQSPAPSGAPPDDQQTGFCSLHQVQMTLRGESPDTWHSHWLEDEQRYCKGVRPNRRNGQSRR